MWGQTPNPDQHSCPLRRTKLQGTLWKMNRIGWKGAQRRIHASRGMDFVLDITRALIDGSAAVCSASPPPSLRLWLSDDVSISRYRFLIFPPVHLLSALLLRPLGLPLGHSININTTKNYTSMYMGNIFFFSLTSPLVCHFSFPSRNFMSKGNRPFKAFYACPNKQGSFFCFHWLSIKPFDTLFSILHYIITHSILILVDCCTLCWHCCCLYCHCSRTLCPLKKIKGLKSVY